MRKYLLLLMISTIATLVFSSLAQAACEVTITGNDAIQYDKKEVTVDATCETITVTLTHIGKLPKAGMGHNFVVSKTGDMAGVVADGAKAGVDREYIASGDQRVVCATKLVGGGESTTTSCKGSALEKGGDYSFYCTFPGHSVLMKGKFIVQ